MRSCLDCKAGATEEVGSGGWRTSWLAPFRECANYARPAMISFKCLVRKAGGRKLCCRQKYRRMYTHLHGLRVKLHRLRTWGLSESAEKAILPSKEPGRRWSRLVGRLPFGPARAVRASQVSSVLPCPVPTRGVNTALASRVLLLTPGSKA